MPYSSVVDSPGDTYEALRKKGLQTDGERNLDYRLAVKARQIKDNLFLWKLCQPRAVTHAQFRHHTRGFVERGNPFSCLRCDADESISQRRHTAFESRRLPRCPLSNGDL
jgi:hypothetical protein